MHLALLRGVNVGGKNRAPMADIKRAVENLGFERVSTYINSGNVLFDAGRRSAVAGLTTDIERAIEGAVGFHVDVLVWDLGRLRKLVRSIRDEWVNNDVLRCDVIFLWPDVDDPGIVDDLPRNPEVDEVTYLPGALVWRFERAHAGRSRLNKVVGTPVYRRMSIRNVTTVRTLLQKMEDSAAA